MDNFNELLKKWKGHKVGVREYMLPFNPLTEYEDLIAKNTTSWECTQPQGRSDLWRFKFELPKVL